MAGKKKPKYGIGETVVVTIYGTVGTITDVKFLFLFERIHVILLNTYNKE
ncbi:hypothetical protein [Priestia megaterium]